MECSGTEVYGFAVVSRAWTRGHCQDRHLGPPETSSPQYPPGSSGNSDSGDSSRNKCQDTRGTQRLLPAPGWEMGVREANPSSTKSYGFLEFQLVRLACSTPDFCIVDDCPRLCAQDASLPCTDFLWLLDQSPSTAFQEKGQSPL